MLGEAARIIAVSHSTYNLSPSPRQPLTKQKGRKAKHQQQSPVTLPVVINENHESYDGTMPAWNWLLRISCRNPYATQSKEVPWAMAWLFKLF